MRRQSRLIRFHLCILFIFIAEAYTLTGEELKKKVLRRLLGSGCIEPLIQFHGTTESHGERACYYALGCG